MALLTKSESAIDGIYFNPVEGEAGTSSPVGTPEHPVNNLADAITLMFARNLKKLYLVGARYFQGTHTAANNPTIMTDANNLFKPNSLIGLTIYNDTDGSSGVITANDEHTITVAALVGGGANIWTTGDGYHVADALDNQPYRIVFDRNVILELVGNEAYDVVVDPGILVTLTSPLVCYNLTNTTGTFELFGCKIAGNLSNTTGNIWINGDCKVAGIISQTDAGTITISGNCKVGGSLENTTGGILITGDCKTRCDLSNTTGGINIAGDCKVGGSLENTTGGILITGDCKVGGDVSNTTGTIKIYGNCQIGDNLDNEGSISHCNIQFMRASATMDLLLSAISFTSRVVSRGVLIVSQMAAGAETTIDLCGGILTIAADCTGGTIDLYGDCAVNDLSGGTVTVNDYRVPGHS